MHAHPLLSTEYYVVLNSLRRRLSSPAAVLAGAAVIDPSTGNVLVRGFTAAPGFDVASGWGTVDALSPGSGGTTAVTSTGFLPRHPVKLAVDGTVITTLTASDQGTVSYTLSPAALA